MATEQEIKVKINALVAGLSEVKKLQKELQGVEKLAGKKLSVNTTGAEQKATKLTGLLRNISSASDSTLGKLDLLGTSGGASLSALTGPAGLVVAGIAAIGGAAVGLAKQLFDVTKAASDTGSAIFDMQQKTNLSAETLSILKVQAEQSSSSLDTAGNSVAKFNKNLVEAADGNKEFSAALKIFGIDAKTAFQNPEAALLQFIKRFNELPDSARKNAAAQKLFNDRTGEMLPVLKSFGSDIDGLRERLTKLGLIWTQDGIVAADAFGDALTELEQTVEGLKKEIATGAMPAIKSAIGSTSDSLAENQAKWRAWGESLGSAINMARVALDAFSVYLKSPLSPFFGVYWISVGIRYLGDNSPARGIEALLNGKGDSAAGQTAGNIAGGLVGGAVGSIARKPASPFSSSSSGGSGGKGKKETADDRAAQKLKELTEQLRQAEAEQRRFAQAIKDNNYLLDLDTKATDENRLAQELLSKSYVGLSEPLRQQLLDKARELDSTNAITEALRKRIEKAREADKEVTAFLKQYAEDLRYLVEGEKTASQVTEEFIAKLEKQGTTLNKTGAQFLRVVAILKDMKSAVEALDFSKFGNIPLPEDPNADRQRGDQFANIFDDEPPESPQQSARRDFLKELREAAGDSGIQRFLDALSDIRTGAASAKEAFRDMALGIIEDIQRLVVEFLVLEGVKRLLGFLGGGSSSETVFSGLGGGVRGLAAGDLVPAQPGGRIIQVAEAGYDEVVLTTDPKHRNRTEGLLSEFLSRTGIMPQFATGGFVRGVLGSITPPVPRLAAGAFVEAPTTAQLGGGPLIGKQTNNLVLPNVTDASTFRQSRQTIKRDLGRLALQGARRVRGGQG